MKKNINFIVLLAGIALAMMMSCEDETAVLDTRVPDVTSVSVTSNSLQLPDETSVTLSGVFNNENGLTVGSYEWKVVAPPALPGGADIVNTEDGILSAKVTGLNIAGTYKFQLTVIGSNGAVTVVEDVIEVVVNEEVDVRKPTINGIMSDPTLELADDETSVTLTAAGAKSADGSGIKSYSWEEITQLPLGATLTNTNNLSATVTGLNVAGTYEFKLTVIGSNDVPATSIVTVTVADNRLPVVGTVSADATTLRLPSGTGTTLKCTGGVTILGDVTLDSYKWIQTNGTAITPSNTVGDNYDATISSLSAGTYKFKLEVKGSNGKVGTSSNEVTVTVMPALSVTAEEEDETLSLTGNSVNVSLTSNVSNTFTDETIGYTWTCSSFEDKYSGASDSAYAESITIGNTANPTVTLSKAGTYVFSLSISGNGGDTAITTTPVTVTVTDAREPKITSIGASSDSITVPAKTGVTLACTTSSADGSSAKSVLWSVESKPTGANPKITNAGTSPATVSDMNVAGVYKFKLVVTGNNNITKTEYVTVNAGLSAEVEFVPLAVPSMTTIDFSPTDLPAGVTYTLTDNKSSHIRDSAEEFDGTVDISDYPGLTDVIVFTQTFYLNGTKIEGIGNIRTIEVEVLAGMAFSDVISDTGALTLQYNP